MSSIIQRLLEIRGVPYDDEDLTTESGLVVRKLCWRGPFFLLVLPIIPISGTSCFGKQKKKKTSTTIPSIDFREADG